MKEPHGHLPIGRLRPQVTPSSTPATILFLVSPSTPQQRIPSPRFRPHGPAVPTLSILRIPPSASSILHVPADPFTRLTAWLSARFTPRPSAAASLSIPI